MIDWFHQKFIATVKVEDSSQRGVRETTVENEMVPAEPASDVSKLQVNEIIQQIRSSRQKEKFERLFDGDIQGYASASEADLALCSILSLWTKNTPGLIDSIFRQSNLYRPKWDEKHIVMEEPTVRKQLIRLQNYAVKSIPHWLLQT